MDRKHLFSAAMMAALFASPALAAETLFPAAGAKAVNPDTPLKLTFSSTPTIGKSGKVRIYDAATDKLVDTLDMSIPAGPTERNNGPVAPYLTFPYPYDGPRITPTQTPSPARPRRWRQRRRRTKYQLTIIGGFTDGFHFYPVTVDRNTATIHPHNNLLQYGHSVFTRRSIPRC